MKLSITVLFLSILINCKAQKQDTLYKIMNGDKVAAYLLKDAKQLTIKDSLGTIFSLINNINELSKYKEAYTTAAEVLNTISLNGTITDVEKFKEAMRKYYSKQN